MNFVSFIKVHSNMGGMKKGILSCEEIAALFTHWPELEREKLERFFHQTTRTARVFDRMKGRTIAGEVLHTPAIITAPFHGGRMALNGKHRSVIALYRGTGLVHYQVESENDIRFGLPRELYSDLRPQSLGMARDPSQKAIIELFYNMETYHQICANAGVPRIGDYFSRAGVPTGCHGFVDASQAAVLSLSKSYEQ
jgi:hypothetical protein